MDPKALQDGRNILESYSPWQLHGHTSWWIYAAGLALLAIVVISLAACVYYHKCLFVLWKLTHKSEGAVAWYRSRAPRLTVGEEINSLRSEVSKLREGMEKAAYVRSDIDEDLSEEGTLDSMILE